MKYDLSVILPGIRVDRWNDLYKSFKESFHGKGEMIIVSPYDLPENLRNEKDIKLVHSFRSPSACYQIAHEASSGKWISWSADDCTYLPNSLDNAFEIIKNNNFDPKTIVTAKYLEGEASIRNPKESNMSGRSYYHLTFHDDLKNLNLFPDDYMMLNASLIPSKLLKDFGGIDCKFEASLCNIDVAIRIQNDGLKFIFLDEVLYTCGHFPGCEGDHGPIYHVTVEHDYPLFKQIYCDKKSLERTKIPFEVTGEEVWRRRFKG